MLYESEIRPIWLVNHLLALPDGSLAVSAANIENGEVNNPRIYFMSANNLIAPYSVVLPIDDTQGSGQQMTFDNLGRLLCTGFFGAFDPNFNSTQVAVWRLVLAGQYTLDLDFAESGRLLLPNPSNFPVLPGPILYDGAFRMVILARRLQSTSNNNDIVIYRRYSEDGRPDASLSYTGELFAPTFLSEDLFGAQIDAKLRVIAAGSQNRIFNESSNLRRDDSYFMRFLAQVGNCTLGGPSCSCSSSSLCTYDGFVLTVAGADSRPARIRGRMEISPNVRLSASVSLIQTQPLFAVSGTLLIGKGAILAASVDGPGEYVIATAGDGINGTFGSVLVTVANGAECGVVGMPVYSSSTLSITVTACLATTTDEGLSVGAIVGIAVGSVAFAVGATLLLVLLMKQAIKSRTIRENKKLKDNDLSDMKFQTTK